MCTAICWDILCRNNKCPRRACRGVLYKDRHSVPGHVCRTARARGRAGLCRTGVVWSTYQRVSVDEACVACELLFDTLLPSIVTVGISCGGGAPLTAETCDEAAVGPLEAVYGSEASSDDVDAVQWEWEGEEEDEKEEGLNGGGVPVVSGDGVDGKRKAPRAAAAVGAAVRAPVDEDTDGDREDGGVKLT